MIKIIIYMTKNCKKLNRNSLNLTLKSNYIQKAIQFNKLWMPEQVMFCNFNYKIIK